MSTSFKVEAFIYGYDQRRLEIDLEIPITKPNITRDMNKSQAYAQEQLQQVMLDLKHSYGMKCEFCGKTARENYVTVGSYLHLPPKGHNWMGRPSPGPKLNVYTHSICRLGGSCGQQARAMATMMGLISQAPEVKFDDGDYEDDIKFPRNGSCARCKKPKGPYSKCAACKSTQYCSKECQAADWSRHKKTCKWIKGARLVAPDQTVKTRKENTN